MRCQYVQTDCVGAPEGMSCFSCSNCGKKIIIVPQLASRINEITQSFPDCPSGTPPQPGPSLGAAQVTIPNNAIITTAAPAPTPPAAPPGPPPVPYKWDPAGAGTQLKKLLAKVGITSTENCSCNARARVMNEKGIEWCEQNVNEIVGWLKEEAGRRKLPFLSLPAKIVVQRAIKIAKKIRDSQPADPADEEITPEESSSAAV